MAGITLILNGKRLDKQDMAQCYELANQETAVPGLLKSLHSPDDTLLVFFPTKESNEEKLSHIILADYGDEKYVNQIEKGITKAKEKTVDQEALIFCGLPPR